MLSLELLLVGYRSLRLEQKVLITIVLLAGLYGLVNWVLEWLSFDWGKREKHIRGARIESVRTLNARTKKSGSASSRNEHFKLGEINLPHELEFKHLLLVGTTGAGKSTAIHQLIPVAQRRGQRQIILDLAGEFERRHKQRGDSIFAPGRFDSVRWNPLAEIRNDADVDLVFESIVPAGKGESAQEWNSYARSFLKALARRLIETNELSIERLHYWVSVAGEKELKLFLSDGERPYRVLENGMTSSVKSITQNCIESLRHAHPAADFSVREWVRSGKGGLYISIPENARAAMSGLVSMLVNMAITEALSAANRPYAPISVFADEVSAYDLDLEVIGARGRKYQVFLFAGMQNISQLQKAYGMHGATTLLACFGTKVIFNPGDYSTAELMAAEIGREEVESCVASYGDSPTGRTTSETIKREIRHLVLPDELLRLPSLHAYVKFSGDYPVAKTEFRYEVKK